MPASRIEIRGPVFVFDLRKRPISDQRLIAALAGRSLTDEPISQYIADDLHDDGVRGGSLAIEVRRGRPSWVATFTAPRKLSARKLAALVAEADAQISDGIAENGFDLTVGRRRLHLDLGWERRTGGRMYSAKQMPTGSPDGARSAPSLFSAIRAGNSNRVLKLLERGAAIDEVSRFGATPIFAASLADQWGIFRTLVERGANLAHRMDSGRSILMHALMSNAPTGIVRLILEHGADVNAVDGDGRTALMWAANRGNLSSVKLLMKAGANPKARDQDKRSALFYVDEKRSRIAALLK